jgi:uncharacterized protein
MKSINALMLATLTLPLVADAQNAVRKNSEPIIDMHMHARNGPLKSRDGKLMPAFSYGGAPERPPPAYTEPGSILRGTLDKMEKHNIVLGHLSDFGEWLSRWSEVAPDRFFVSARVGVLAGQGPIEPRDVEKLREEILAGKYRGIGEITTQYSGIAPNDPKLALYFSLAEELDVPVLLHMGGLGARRPGFRSAMGRPTLLEDVLVKHRKLRIYIENASYPYLDEIIAIMTQYPNVHADVSTITWLIPRTAFHRYLRALVEAGLGDRLMFGSDQMHWPEAIDWAVDAIESADFLTPQQKRDIFYNNAARFLRLSEAEIARHHGRASSE